jgi:hypothetical protein
VLAIEDFGALDVAIRPVEPETELLVGRKTGCEEQKACAGRADFRRDGGRRLGHSWGGKGQQSQQT